MAKKRKKKTLRKKLGIPTKIKHPKFKRSVTKSTYKKEKEYLERLFEHHHHKKTPYEHLEHWVDKLIPFLIVALMALIIIEFKFKDFAHHYEHQIHLADQIIIGFFVVDLIIKYTRVRHVPMFLKHFWVDVLAVFPFYLAFRMFETILGLSRAVVAQTQTIVHESMEVQKQATRVGKQITKASKAARAARMARIARLVRVFQRIPRLLKGLHYFEKPSRYAKRHVPKLYHTHIKKHAKKRKRRIKRRR